MLAKALMKTQRQSAFAGIVSFVHRASIRYAYARRICQYSYTDSNLFSCRLGLSHPPL